MVKTCFSNEKKNAKIVVVVEELGILLLRDP